MAEKKQTVCESPRFWPDDYALLKADLAEAQGALEAVMEWFEPAGSGTEQTKAYRRAKAALTDLGSR